MTLDNHSFKKIASVGVVGAGNMGSGIAQKIATEGVAVTLIDTNRDLAEEGKKRIERLMVEGLDKGLFTPEQIDEILARIKPSADMEAAADCDLVIEAVFEDSEVKKDVFRQLGEICRPNAILATNTSSFLVADVAEETKNPERVVGLHYFYHPAKNRLVEVIGHGDTSKDVLARAWAFQERIGKTPIGSLDSPGYVVNRFFVPWLNEAVRLHEQDGVPIATIEEIAKGAFGIGMGPFELMNVTGPAITMHAAKSLAGRLGDFYAPSPAIGLQVANGTDWELHGDVHVNQGGVVSDRLWGVVFHIALELVSEGVCTVEDIDIGARVGLRWRMGPFETMNSFGIEKTAELCAAIRERYGLEEPKRLAEQRAAGTPFTIERVTLRVDDGVGTILINRPDQLNALDPATIEQLGHCFEEAEGRADVSAIVIAGAGKAFVAGADVKWFVDRIHDEDIEGIVDFAAGAQKLFRRIEKSNKRVICRLDGMALGGGAELALACHVIIATPKGSMAFPETGIGIYPGLGGTQRLTRRLGKGPARYIIYTGNPLTAEELGAMDIAWKVVEADEIEAVIRTAVDKAPVQPKANPDGMSRDLKEIGMFVGAVPVQGLMDGSLTLPGGGGIHDLARKIRRKAPNALEKVAELTEIADQGDFDAGLEAETNGLHAIFSAPNALEGMSALLERRRPEFQKR